MDRETISVIVRGSLDEELPNLRNIDADLKLKERTKAVKTRLCEAGNPQNFYTCASGVYNANCREWLYDVCWLKYYADRPPAAVPQLDFLKEAVLIVECEWGNRGDIRDDFQKLLVGRARVRCMIWQDREPDKRRIVDWLAGMVWAYSGTTPDDFYLLARYTDEGFQYWHLSGNGYPSQVPDFYL